MLSGLDLFLVVYVLTFYTDGMINVFIRCRVSCRNLWCIETYHLQIRTLWNFPFLFVFALTYPSVLMNRNWDSGHLYIVLNLSFSVFIMMLTEAVLLIVFSMYWYVPCILTFSRTLTRNHNWILSKAFFTNKETTIVFMSLNLFMWKSAYIDFLVRNDPCISGMETSWS